MKWLSFQEQERIRLAQEREEEREFLGMDLKLWLQERNGNFTDGGDAPSTSESPD